MYIKNLKDKKYIFISIIIFLYILLKIIIMISEMLLLKM